VGDTFQIATWWAGVGTGAAWTVTLLLFAVGLAGCVIPALPGHLFILIGGVSHRLMLGPEGSGLQWWSFLVLGLLMAASQTFEFLSGAAGAKWFGGTRWGAAGALVGSIVGLFFFPLGLLVGPLAGAVFFEMAFARQQTRPALTSGVGSVVGTLAGMGFKMVVALAMILWFFLDVFFIGI
jgi:uncharacterized protein